MTTKTKSTGHRATDELGPTVVDGEVRWLGATIIAKGDPSQEGGCERKWWYRYVDGLEEPETGSQRGGKEVHDQIERYLRGEGSTLGRVALAGKRFIPHPGADLLIEQSIWEWGLRAGGVPIAGHSDLFNLRGWYVDPEGETQADPPQTGEVKDWKSTSSFEWAKSSEGLFRTVQMPLYAKALLHRFPELEHARMTHVYFRTKGAPDAKLVTIRKSRAEVDERWQEIVDGPVARLKQVARATCATDVTPNRKACPAFRGCAFRGRCPDGQAASLSSLFGEAGAREILGLKEENMATNLLATLGLGTAAAPAAPAQTTTPPPAPTEVKLTMAQELAKLKATEAAKAAARAPAVPPGFAEACKTIEDSGYGFPTLGGEAAQARGAMKGMAVSPEAGLSGTGQLAGILFRTCEEVINAAAEISGSAPTITATVVPIVPPETPASDPKLAADPVEGFGPPPAPAAEETVVEKPKRGRKPKAASAPTAGDAPVVTAGETDLELYVNAIPCGVSVESLDGYVADLAAKLAADFKMSDIRLGQGDAHPLGFGRWRGALAAYAREAPPSPGSYMITTRGNELAEVVVEALRPLARVFVRGVAS